LIDSNCFTTSSTTTTTTTQILEKIQYDFNSMRSVAIACCEYGYNSSEDTIKDLKIIKKSGFNSVKLWLDPSRGIDSGIESDWLNKILTAADELNLSVFPSTIPTMNPGENIWDFPWNEDKVQSYIKFAENLTNVGKNHPSLAFYNIWVPVFNPNTINESTKQKIDDVYSRFVNAYRQKDPKHMIALWGDPHDQEPLYYFPRVDVDAFGFQPYSNIKDNIHIEKINLLYNNAKRIYPGKPVFVDEVGFRTYDPYRKPIPYGLASNETMKAELIKELSSYFKNLNVGWSYFMLKDRWPTREEGDWGIVEWNGTFRQSGLSLSYELRGCRLTELKDPITEPVTPNENQNFKIYCSVNGIYDCIGAYVDYEDCPWIGWTGNTAIFNCSGTSYGIHFAKCSVGYGNSNCCVDSSTKQFTVQ